ncbi:MAG: DUF1893 domain-containing protein [Faecalibacterium sp.]|nr:DUF1893 domain-containing protein [Ruminococcus sp.]MCM1392315.1 DUF1893 domain-containing protein [Ruminococcus sp.]MCM1486361.1 DUF1893 domain-containing protein [Faecalibacterium sp.]
MNNDLAKAMSLMREKGYTCVLCKSDIQYVSNERGVKPLLQWLEKRTDLSGFSASDKVIGKATAFLYIIARVKAVYTDVISESALNLLEDYNIAVYYDKVVSAIRNRTNTGFCPMEQAVKDINDPVEAHTAIVDKINQLKKII